MCARYRVPIPPKLPAVDRTLLRDDVYGRLRDAIIDGTFEPGEQLRDGELAQWLGVSRTPFREAVAVLASEGLVDIRPYRGFSVHRPTAQEIDDLYQLRRALESFAIRLAVENVSNADIARLAATLDAAVSALEQGDLDAYGAHDAAFHAAIARYSVRGDDVNHREDKAGRLTDAYRPSRLMAIEELPLALGFCLFNNGEFRRSIEDGINSGRDTDSIGAMAGALLGALHGEEVIAAEDRALLDSANRLNLTASADAFTQTATAILAADRAAADARRTALDALGIA